MEDVTSRMNSFRECARHLWNVDFLPLVEEARDRWELRDGFDDVCSLLFASLVVGPLGLDFPLSISRALAPDRTSGAPSLPWLRVVPNGPAGVPIMINRDPVSDVGYWDHPLQRVSETDVDLRMVRWFDFDVLGFRDLRYYLVRIQGAAEPGVIGRAALIECEYTRVIVKAEAL
jgi:hypothetical protein